MAQPRDIRRRIKSVKKTQQVTRAMKMIAASKLRKAQEAIINARPYSRKLRETISWLLISEDLPVHPLLAQPEGDDLHLIVLTGEKGLCGGFNASVFREAAAIVSRYPARVDLIVLGKKGVEHYRKKKFPVAAAFAGFDKQSPLALSTRIASEITRCFIDGTCRKVAITYTEFISALSQRVVTEWLLPMEFEKPSDLEMNLNYLFHPDPLRIVEDLLPRYIRSQIYRAILESQASEYGARMTAMDNATRNSEEMISHLTLQYNQARQSAITRELIEIVSGAEALKG
ncbi:ATP synthase F1 subunit gamma [bacterium]|nr:ATP synthase F1 subunit gamma [candidate division CSSED10-310 bacterium]